MKLNTNIIYANEFHAEIVYMNYNRLDIKIDSVHIKKFYYNLKKWKFSKMNCLYDDFFDEQKFKEELKQKIDYVN